MKAIEKRVLPADVFDVLEFSALVFGGVGANFFAEPTTVCYPPPGLTAPICLLGHAGFVTELAVERYTDGPVAGALADAFGGDVWSATKANNDAVQAINARRGKSDISGRVSWKALCAELNIVRGD